MSKKYAVKLAYNNPSLRPILIPMIKSAMEFSSKEELQQYLKDHPNADPKNHSVKENSKSEAKKELSPEDKKLKGDILAKIKQKSTKLKSTFNEGFAESAEEEKKQRDQIASKVDFVTRNINFTSEMKELPKEVKGAAKVINDRTSFSRNLAGMSTYLVTKPIFLATLGLATGGAGLGVSLASVVLASATTVVAKKALENRGKKKIEEKEDISDVSMDILLGKYTPNKINKEYAKKVSDIEDSIFKGKMSPEKALGEIEKIEKEYKEKVKPGIEKALTSVGFKKNENGSYENGKLNSFFESSNKKLAAEDDTPSQLVNIRMLKKQLQNQVEAEKIFQSEEFVEELIRESNKAKAKK